MSLTQDESHSLPSPTIREMRPTDPEVKESVGVFATTTVASLDRFVKGFSSRSKLKTAVAWILAVTKVLTRGEKPRNMLQVIGKNKAHKCPKMGSLQPAHCNRPVLSSDPHDLDPLTPNHLPLLHPVSMFWARWFRECLPHLQGRTKWTIQCVHRSHCSGGGHHPT